MLWKLLINAAIFSLSLEDNVFSHLVPKLKLAPEFVPCNEGWLNFGEKCYKICGRHPSQRAHWDDAAYECTMMRGDLVTIQSKEELDFLISFLVLDIKSNVWIGLKKRVVDSEQHWHDGSVTNYTNWGSNRDSVDQDLLPRTPFQTKECVEMIFSPYKNNFGQWYVASCNSKKPYICQKKKDIRKTTPNTLFCDSNKNGGWKFEQSCYHLVTKPQTWYEAEEHCRKEFKGHLVTILDVTVDYFLNHILSRLKEDFWIGIKTKNQFQQKWTSGWQVAYNAGLFNNQSNFNDGSCVLRSSHNAWTKAECSKTYSFICETSTVLPPILKPAVSGFRCPINANDWRDFGGEFCYFVPPPGTAVTWNEANYACKKRGGNLVSIHSKEESDILSPFIRFHSSNMFIGLFRTFENDKNFAWSDDSKLDFENWNINEPSSERNLCVAIRNYQSFNVDAVAGKNDLRWYVVNCEDQAPYICSVRKTDNLNNADGVQQTCTFNSTTKEMCECSGQVSVNTLISVIMCIILINILIGVIVFYYFRPWNSKLQKRTMSAPESRLSLSSSESRPRYRSQTEFKLPETIENDIYEPMYATPYRLPK